MVAQISSEINVNSGMKSPMQSEWTFLHISNVHYVTSGDLRKLKIGVNASYGELDERK